MEIVLEKLNQSYKVLTDTGVELGSFQIDCSGSYGYWRNETSWGFESSYILRAIADKLDEVNKPLDDLQKLYFTNERKLFEEKAEKEYKEVLKSGMFFQWYPGMSGDWDRDTENWLTEYEKLEELRRDFTPY